MENALTDFVFNESINIDFNNFLRNLVVVSLLSFLIQLVYNRFSRSLSNKDYFSKNFIVLGVTTCIVITIVKSSLALSLGLVGALSIVRFRAAIKEPEELVFLFLVIAAGLGCGAGQIKITFTGIIFTLLIIIIYFKFFSNEKNLTESDNLSLNLISSKNYSDEIMFQTMNILNKYCSQIKLSSMSVSKNQTVINFIIQPLNLKSVNRISVDLKKQKNFNKIIFSNNEAISL